MQEDSGSKNAYLDQVMAEQQQVENNLRSRQAPAPMAGMPGPSRGETGMVRTGAAVDVRVTGFFIWKTVVVPPNAYVVHTRRGHDEGPLHVGLGISFRYNPFTDSYLVVPSTMQTILISAHCICSELQGLFVQGYVQWIIADFATAYRKLDFSDLADPMRIVTIQLREQAEAAIKDKVATMALDEVLSDKQPIIEELTARLRQVAEGQGGADEGLGLRIVTVQVKEAVVSSTRLWENLQKPVRAERARIARLAELEAEGSVRARELEQAKTRTTAEIESEAELAALRARKAATAFDREQAESARRHGVEADAAVARAAKDAEVERAVTELEKLRVAEASALARLRLDAENAEKEARVRGEVVAEEIRSESENRQSRFELELETSRHRLANEATPAFIQQRLMEVLPAVAQQLPKPDELRSVNIGAGDHASQGLSVLVAQLGALIEMFGSRAKPPETPSK